MGQNLLLLKTYYYYLYPFNRTNQKPKIYFLFHNNTHTQNRAYYGIPLFFL